MRRREPVFSVAPVRRPRSRRRPSRSTALRAAGRWVPGGSHAAVRIAAELLFPPQIRDPVADLLRGGTGWEADRESDSGKPTRHPAALLQRVQQQKPAPWAALHADL